ncbi:MAG: PEP-CTERM sorting domain-containing protein [Terriglobales bacterium]
MRRIAAMLGLCALLLPLLLPRAAWADPLILNKFGTVSITNGGIVSTGSQLVSFFGITAAPGGDLGSVSFSTGALTSGSIWSGGTFGGGKSSSFVVLGVGRWAKRLTGENANRVTLFVASFVGPIQWKLVSHTGYDYVFTLSGMVSGDLFTGRSTRGLTKQTIFVYQNQWVHDHRGGIGSGNTDFGVNVPEPGTLGLFGMGVIVLGAAMRRKPRSE